MWVFRIADFESKIYFANIKHFYEEIYQSSKNSVSKNYTVKYYCFKVKNFINNMAEFRY